MKVRIALAPNKFAGGGEIPPYRTGDPSVLKRDLNNRVILPSFNDLFSNHRPEDIYEEEGYIPQEQGKGHQYTYNDIYTDYIGRLNKYNQSLPANDSANILTNEKRTSQGLNRIGDTGAMPVVNDMFKGVNTLLGYGMQAPVELAKTALMPGSYIPYVGATNHMGELMSGAVDNTAGALFAPIMPSNYIDWGSAGRDGVHLKLPWQHNSNGIETPAFMLTMDFVAAPYLAKGVNQAVKYGKQYVNPFYEGRNQPVNLTMSNELVNFKPISTVAKTAEPVAKLTLEEKLGLPKHVRRELEKINPSGKYLEGVYYLEDRLNAMESARKKLNSSNEKGVDNLLLESYPNTKLSEDNVVTNRGDLATGAFINERSYNDVSANVGFGRRNRGGHSYGVNMAGRISRKSDLYPEDKILVESPKSEYIVTDKDMARTKKGTRGLLNAMKGMESGAEFSGDAAATTMGEALAAWLRAAKKPHLKETAMKSAKDVLHNKLGVEFGYNNIYDPIRDIWTLKSGMSPDAYYYLYKVALKNPNTFSIGYSTLPAGKFNSFAITPSNKYMYDIEQQLINHDITPKQYVEKYNEWTIPVGGRRAYIKEDGKIYKPLPFLIHKAYGGNLFPDGGILEDDDIPMYGSTLLEAVVTGHRMPAWNRFWNKNFRSKSGWDKYVDRYYARQQQMQDTNNTPNPTYEVPDALSIAGIIAGTPYNEDIERAKVWDTYNNWKEHSEIIGPHYDPDGNYHNDAYANSSAGYLSGNDPVGEFFVLNEAFGPLAKFVGRGTQQVMAKAGNQWARNQIMGRAFNNAADASFGFNNRFITTPASSLGYETKPKIIDAVPYKTPYSRITDIKFDDAIELTDYLRANQAAEIGKLKMENLLNSQTYKERVINALHNRSKLSPYVAYKDPLLQVQKAKLEIVPKIDKTINTNANSGGAIVGKYNPNTHTVTIASHGRNKYDLEGTAQHEYAHASENEELLKLLAEDWKDIKPTSFATKNSSDSELKYITSIPEMRARAMSVLSEMKDKNIDFPTFYKYKLDTGQLDGNFTDLLFNFGKENMKQMVNTVYGLAPLGFGIPYLMNNNNQ